MGAKYIWFMLWLITAFGFTISMLFYPIDSSAQMSGTFFAKRHILYGSIELTYNRQWLNDNPLPKEFGQNYTLGLRSYIIDPRLISLDTTGIFTRTSSNEGSISSLTGINFNLSFLNTPPRKWKGFRRYIPGPIMLRYSNYNNDYNISNYGASITYSIPEARPKATKEKDEKKEKDKKMGIPFPKLYFDYDKYNYSSKNYDAISDLYSLRAVLSKQSYNYDLLYENFDQRGTTNLKKNSLTLRPNYTFYSKETGRKIDFNNFLKIEEIDDTDKFLLRSSLRWYKPFKRDRLLLSGQGTYLSSLTKTDKDESYTVSTLGSYTKALSQRTINTTTLTLTYGETNSKPHYSERLHDAITHELSNLFRLRSGISYENNEKGAEYGINTMLSTKTKITASTGYLFNFLSYYNEEKLTHKLNLSTSGPLKDNLSFSTDTSYTMNDVSGGVRPYSENILTFSMTAFWRLRLTTLSLGGNYSEVSKGDGEKTKNRLISFNSNLSRNIATRTSLNLYSTWTKEFNGRTILDIHPILRSRIKQIFLDLDYSYRTTSGIETPAFDEHRIFLRAIRRFSKVL